MIPYDSDLSKQTSPVDNYGVWLDDNGDLSHPDPIKQHFERLQNF